MDPFQLIAMLRGNTNPMQLLTNMMGGNPLFNRALQMAQGKDVNALRMTARNMATQNGMNEEQFNAFLRNFGID